MDKLAALLTDYIIKNDIIDKDDSDTYQYGFVVALETGFSMAASIIIAAILHMPVECILFFVVFIPLRSYAGGLHMEKYYACFTLSCAVLTAALLVVKFMEFPILPVIFVQLICETLIYVLYPVENSNRQVDKEEDAFFKKKLCGYLIADIGISGICVLFNKEKWVLLIAVTLVMIVLTMSVAKYKNKI